jgi:signal transduction histidine kinase
MLGRRLTLAFLSLALLTAVSGSAAFVVLQRAAQARRALIEHHFTRVLAARDITDAANAAATGVRGLIYGDDVRYGAGIVPQWVRWEAALQQLTAAAHSDADRESARQARLAYADVRARAEALIALRSRGQLAEAQRDIGITFDPRIDDLIVNLAALRQQQDAEAAQMAATTARADDQALWVLIVALAASTAILTYLARSLHRALGRPLRELAAAAEAVGKGREWHWTLPAENDFTPVVRAFDEMAARGAAARERAEAELRGEQAEQARLEGALLVARTVAHEINNALAPVTGYADLLTLQPEIVRSPSLTAHVAAIAVASGRVAEKVRLLQGIVRLEEIPSDLGPGRSLLDLERSSRPHAHAR